MKLSLLSVAVAVLPFAAPVLSGPQPCVGDLNGDNQINVDDVLLFIQYMAERDMRADLNEDGALDIFDFIEMQAALARGCPTAGEIPVLTPGPGFTGPTPQPPSVGSAGAFGYDAKAIARWDVVPFQTFTGEFHIGVVAFHINGIDRVEFSANGGPWVDVHHMQLNPRTGVWEYTVTLDASLFDVEEVEVRAIAWPGEAGVPRILDELHLNADPDGSVLANRQVRWVATSGSNTSGDGSEASPFATIKQAAMSINQAQGGNVDNGLIYLMDGDYAFSGGWQGAAWVHPVTLNAWLTISAAPGQTQVRITGGGTNERLNASLIHLRNLTQRTDLVSSNNGLNRPASLWWDNCIVTSGGRLLTTHFSSGFTGPRFLTDSTIRETANGPGGVALSRNVHAENIGSDPFQNVQVLLNATVNGIDPTGWQAAGLAEAPHPDVVQWHLNSGSISNVIVYGLRAVDNIVGSQGIFFGGGASHASDFAIVNAMVAGNNQWHIPTNHMVVWNSTFLSPFMWRTGGSLHGGGMQNVSIRHNVFASSMTNEGNPGTGGAFIANNHYSHGTLWGSQATVGDPVWHNAASGDYRPGAGSPLRNRVEVLLTPTDLNGNEILIGTGSIGAMQP